MNCPACGKPMAILEYKGVELDFCLSCRGCWLDWGELGIFLRGELDFSENWDLTGARKGERRCPRCRTRMRVGTLPDVSVEADVCPKRHGVWFDGGELAQVIRARGQGEAPARARQWLQEVFGGDGESAKPEGGGT